MASGFMIGTTAESMTALDLLATPLLDPQWEFREYRRIARLGDGVTRGLGPRTIIWSFPMIETNQIEQLEFYKSNDPIYVRTRKRNQEFGKFQVIQNWNDPRQDGGHLVGFRGYRTQFEIEFIVLLEVAE